MLKTENEKLSEDLDEAMDTIVDLEKQIKELENRPRESYEDTTKIEELTKKLLLAEGKLAQAEKNQGTGNVKSAADTEAVFKAYMAAVITSLNHVSRFLESHRNDPANKLGHAISAAFIATILGIFTGYVIWLPFANKLKVKSANEIGYKRMIIETKAKIDGMIKC